MRSFSTWHKSRSASRSGSHPVHNEGQWGGEGASCKMSPPLQPVSCPVTTADSPRHSRKGSWGRAEPPRGSREEGVHAPQRGPTDTPRAPRGNSHRDTSHPRTSRGARACAIRGRGTKVPTASVSPWLRAREWAWGFAQRPAHPSQKHCGQDRRAVGTPTPLTGPPRALRLAAPTQHRRALDPTAPRSPPACAAAPTWREDAGSHRVAHCSHFFKEIGKTCT